MSQRSNQIPEFLVRVDYHLPLLDDKATMFFEDKATFIDAHYREALRVFVPAAIIRNVERKVRPVPEGC